MKDSEVRNFFGRLAFFVFVLSSCLIVNPFGLKNQVALANSVVTGGQDPNWRDRRPGRDERDRLRREERDELARIRGMDRDHRLRYRMNNRVRNVGYFDRWGNFHQYGYYDRWGYFHRY